MSASARSLLTDTIMDESEPTVEISFGNGTLLSLIVEKGFGEADSLVDECVDLHNRGRIDVLSVIEGPKFEAVSGHDFFAAQNFFRHAIPRLTGVSVERMLRCTEALVRKGSGDMMAYRPNEALLEWLKAEGTRSSEVVTKARRGDALALDHLTFALQATADLNLMRELVADANPRVRQSALTAISRTPHPDDGERSKTVGAVGALVGPTHDDAKKATILAALLLPFVHAKAVPPDEALSAARKIADDCGAGTVHVAGQVLLAAGEWCPAELRNVLLDALRRIHSGSKGTIDLVDVALCPALKGDGADNAVKYVEDVIGRDDDSLKIGSLNSFVRDWADKRRDLLDKAVALWLASGKRLLCQAVDELVSEGGLRGEAFNVDIAALELSPSQQYLMCRKAIGYLFMKPVSAASILVSTLRSADDDLASAVKDLLFDPLLVSFSGSVLEYLEAVPATDPAQVHVADLIARTRQYLDGFNTSGAARELRPSEYQRQLQRIRDANFQREIRKNAEKRSIFHDLVHKSVLLHGSGSVTFVEGPDGGRKPMHMKLHGFSTTSEWPRLETIDPVGLDIVLRTCRASQLKS